MNAQVKMQLDQLCARLKGPLTVEQAKEEYWTLRRCVSIQQDNAVLHACTKAKSAVDDAVLKATVKERMEKNFRVVPSAQKKQVESAKASVRNRTEKLRLAIESERKLKTQIEDLQSALAIKEDEEEALKTKLEVSEQDTKCMAKIAARVSIENVRLNEQIEELKRKAQEDAVTLQNRMKEVDELTEEFFTANTQSDLGLSPMAEQVQEDAEEMDLLDKLDMEGFRGIH